MQDKSRKACAWPDCDSGDLLRDMSTKIDKISTVLLGVEGTAANGLVGQVKRQGDSLSKLRRHFYMAAAFLCGSGVLGISLFEALK